MADTSPVEWELDSPLPPLFHFWPNKPPTSLPEKLVMVLLMLCTLSTDIKVRPAMPPVWLDPVIGLLMTQASRITPFSV